MPTNMLKLLKKNKIIICSTATANESIWYQKYKECINEQVFSCLGVDKSMANCIFDSSGWKVYINDEYVGGFDWGFNYDKKNSEMKLGQIVEVKNELNDIFDGEVIMLAPGYSKDDFAVKQVNNNKVIVRVKGNDGYKENAGYLFDLNGDYEVEKLEAKVVNGVFTLKANYKTDGNVEVKGE